jgi:phosphoribosyl-ATP pyrophosphohydrolase/phosphoribosyl-AMP cyclohydrolase
VAHELQPDLLPVIVQDVDTGVVLMLAWTNAEARRRSEETGRAHFWSRSRGALWDKGATSGQVLSLCGIREDCDHDALLYLVRAPHGACHTGRASCFGDAGTAVSMLGSLFALQRERLDHASPDQSYTRRLAEGGIDRVLRKVGEETAEFLVASKNQDPREIRAEAADLVYHLWLALHLSGVSLADVSDELDRRHEPPVPGL